MKKLIKNLAVFGVGLGIGTFGVLFVQAMGLVEGNKIYEDDDVYIKGMTNETNGTQMAMLYNKHTFEGDIKPWLK